jgi:hypothetical protein
VFLVSSRLKVIPLKEGAMKKRTALSGVLLLASFAAAQSAAYFQGSLDGAVAQAKKEGKLVLVEFFQKGG